MPKSVQRLRSLGLDRFPLVFVALQGTFPEIIVSDTAIIASEDIDRPVIEDHRVISPLRWCFSCRLNVRPLLTVKVEVKQIVEVQPPFTLITSEKVEAIHVCNTSCT